MEMKKKITEELLRNYKEYLCEEEKSPRTVEKYLCDLRKLKAYAGGRTLTKELVVRYKKYLIEEKGYRTSSVNSFLVAANRLFGYMKWHDLRVKTCRVQRQAFAPESGEITREEFCRLVKTAKRQGKDRLALTLQAICATGIRVGELGAITVEAAKCGHATVRNKGKERKVLLTRDLQVKLLHYARTHGIAHGPVFCTGSGRVVDRSCVWREMKGLCREARVERTKVSPHSLRRLFARTFYRADRDLATLADILGHSSIETTRIYVRATCEEQRRKLECLRLLKGL